MIGQHVFADEPMAAVGAVEGLLGAVRVHVVLPVGAVGKLSIASGALELFRVLVMCRCNVGYQTAVPTKLFVTHRAGVFLIVRVNSLVSL